MGIDVYLLDLLMKYKAAEPDGLGDTLMLGRQMLYFPTEETRAIATQVIMAHDPASDYGVIRKSGGFAEGFLRYLGSRSVRSMDFSAYEGADIEHDLNTPVPAELVGAFDFIVDGGTIEHVFDVPMAFRNVGAMLRDGGLFIGLNPANNYLGHGLYQFSPELLWRVFSEENGYSVDSVKLVPVTGYPTPVDAPDPAVEQRRLQIGATVERYYVTVAARKRGGTRRPVVLQSDYVATWDQAKSGRS